MKVFIAILSMFSAFCTLVFTGACVWGLMFFLVGCGTYEVPKTEVVESAGECGEGVHYCTSDKEGTEESAGNSEEFESTDDSKGVSEQDIEVLDESIEVGEKTQFIFVAKAKSWQEHVEATPKGYRLATRSEVIGAMEDGEIIDLMNEDESLWTSSEYSQITEMAWVVSFTNDYAVMKTVAFPAVYIAE